MRTSARWSPSTTNAASARTCRRIARRRGGCKQPDAMPGPFAPRTTAAVAACTRALCGSRDDAGALTLSNAATLGGLRAFADRLAIERMFDDPGVHRDHRPSDTAA